MPIGSILTSELLSPPNGNDYVAGEPFSVASGLDLNPANWATGIIDTVDINGTPTSYTLTYGGANDAYTPNVPGFGGQDTLVTGAGDGTFQIFILTVGSADSVTLTLGSQTDVTAATMKSIARVWGFEPRVDEEVRDKATVTVTASGVFSFSADVDWLRCTQTTPTHVLVEVVNPNSNNPNPTDISLAKTYVGTVLFKVGSASATLTVSYIVSPYGTTERIPAH